MSISFLAGLGEGFEDGGGDGQFEDGSQDDGQGSQTQAEEVLVLGEGHCSEGLSSVLNACELNQNGDEEDDEEEGVVEEVGEDVQLSFLQFPGVDFVEDLHQDKGVEEDAVVFAGLVVPLADSDGRLDVEELGTFVK